MREFTIQEKAKRYDEVINRMKHYVIDEYGCSRIKVADVFPELKESEDEKMRAMAIKAVHAPEAQSCIKSWGINPEDVIAWLEKQGEQKPWSELDEDMINGIIRELVHHYNEEIPQETEDEIKWLKKLKNRVGSEANCTTTTEWSKEDNDMMKAIIEDVHMGADFRADVIREANEKEDWLKSIRRRYISLKNTCNWEPTEEQMQALQAATYCQDKAMSKVLFKLHQNLGKLIKVRHEG